MKRRRKKKRKAMKKRVAKRRKRYLSKKRVRRTRKGSRPGQPKKSAAPREYTKDTKDQIQKLIDVGKEKGHLTYDEINDMLPKSVTSSDEIDEIFARLVEEKIKVVDSVEDLPKGDTLAKKVSREKQDAAELTRMPHMEDPVRMYLRQMGQIPL